MAEEEEVEENGRSLNEEFRALQAIISALQDFDVETKRRILESATTFLRLGSVRATGAFSVRGGEGGPSSIPARPAFSDEDSATPKEFMLAKQPKTDIERIACLAYYLTHHRDTPHFKTIDLSKLNTEAAQPKFSNAANAANNAVKGGFLVASTKGQRQISAAGELFVQALPDRAEAKAAMSSVTRKKRSTRSKKRNTGRMKSQPSED